MLLLEAGLTFGQFSFTEPELRCFGSSVFLSTPLVQLQLHDALQFRNVLLLLLAVN